MRGHLAQRGGSARGGSPAAAHAAHGAAARAQCASAHAAWRGNGARARAPFAARSLGRPGLARWPLRAASARGTRSRCGGAAYCTT